MGVLEEAIREHLELKKRHGVSDEEVRRQEAEALGPARREAEGAPEEHAVVTEPADEAVDAQAVEPVEPVMPGPVGDTGLPSPVEEAPAPWAGDAEPPEVLPEVEEDVAEQSPERDRLWPEQKPQSDLDFE